MTWRALIADVPRAGGIYVVLVKGKAIYIGMGQSLRARLVSHPYREQFLSNGADEVRWILIADRYKRLAAEANFIKHVEPTLNATWRPHPQGYKRSKFRLV